MGKIAARTLFIVSFLLLLATNAYWLLQHYRTTNKTKYNATLICEQEELIFCLRTFPEGITFEEFQEIVKKNNLGFTPLWEKEGSRAVEMKDVLAPCRPSGRMYCGIRFVFSKEKLVETVAGHPCH